MSHLKYVRFIQKSDSIPATEPGKGYNLTSQRSTRNLFQRFKYSTTKSIVEYLKVFSLPQ